MRLAISGLAWDISEDEEVARLLQAHGVNAIDVVPAKYFTVSRHVSGGELARLRGWWAERGIEITGMQALLFGTSGLNMFGSGEVRQTMLNYLSAICYIGAGLGGNRVVFGSPKNRDRTGLSDEQVLEIAVPFFRQLGDIAELHGVTICLEPNPANYGANFMTTSAETANVVRQVSHTAIRMQFDTGEVTINSEDPEVVLEECAPLIAHVHASEPGLIPLGDGQTDHARMAGALRTRLPSQIVAIEMMATKDEPHLASIERALRRGAFYYRGDKQWDMT